MNRTLLVSILCLGACGGGDPSGSYDGTLTITATSGNVVATMIANLQPDQDNVDMFSTGTGPNVDCTIQGTSWSGSALQFDCGGVQCWCTVEAADLTVSTATGALENDILTLTFSGEDSTGTAFSAAFMGTLQPGTD